ncbi:MAG: hypothetical protein MUF42_06205 [Cytophagaceae bacterium]|jgi:hypothetical protein|nr:hypothetical protein [Cytophagaceae bacterium]
MKTITSCLLLLWSLSLWAQKVKIEDSKETHGHSIHQGIATTLELDKKEVGKAWEKYMKLYGKLENDKGYYKVSPALLTGLSNASLLSQVVASATGTKVWLCLQIDSTDVTPDKTAEYATAKKLLYEFGVTAYRDDINEQIAEAEKALEQSVQIHERKLKEGEGLEDKLVENQNDKLDFELRQKKNAEDFVRINTAINANLTDQKTALEHVSRIKTELDKPENASSQDLHKTLNEAIKIQQTKVKEGEKLAKELEKNKTTKLELEEKLLKNANEKKELEQKLVQNKADKEAAAQDAEKMRKAVEVVKAKLQTIE